MYFMFSLLFLNLGLAQDSYDRGYYYAHKCRLREYSVAGEEKDANSLLAPGTNTAILEKTFYAGTMKRGEAICYNLPVEGISLNSNIQSDELVKLYQKLSRQGADETVVRWEMEKLLRHDLVLKPIMVLEFDTRHGMRVGLDYRRDNHEVGDEYPCQTDFRQGTKNVRFTKQRIVQDFSLGSHTITLDCSPVLTE